MKSQIVVIFEEGAGEKTIALELDEDRNNGESIFAPGATAWIRAITDKKIEEFGSTRGRFQIDKEHLRFEHEEELIFANEKEATLRYPVHSLLSAQWLGRSPGAVTIQGKTARIDSEGYGVLKIKYNVAYASLKLDDVGQEGNVLVWAVNDIDQRGDMVVDFRFDESGEMEDAYVTVRNYCTKLVVANADIWVGGVYKGKTDQFGRLWLGKYRRGSEHNIKGAAVGFKDTDVDALANDYFVVQ